MTARTCPSCTSAAAPDATFCAECGARLVPQPAMAAHGPAAEPETREMPRANGTTDPYVAPPPPVEEAVPPVEPPTGAWPYGPPAPPTAPPGYHQAPLYPSPPPPPTAARRTTGLLIGLVAASVVALAGVAAALLLALGSEDDPTVADNVRQTTPAETVVREVIRERSRPRTTQRSRSRSNSGASATPAASSASSQPERDTAVSTVTDAQRRAAAEGAVERHWALIESGQYSSAYSLLASSATTASESTWVSEHVEDDLSSVDVSVSASLTSPTTARVDVLRLRTVASSGCFTWTGSYDVAKQGGTWKIAKANLTRSAC